MGWGGVGRSERESEGKEGGPFEDASCVAPGDALGTYLRSCLKCFSHCTWWRKGEPLSVGFIHHLSACPRSCKLFHIPKRSIPSSRQCGKRKARRRHFHSQETWLEPTHLLESYSCPYLGPSLFTPKCTLEKLKNRHQKNVPKSSICNFTNQKQLKSHEE